MKHGGVTLEHVLAFQIRIMMGNQYPILVEGMKENNKKAPVVACLRLGWNDAFRHTSENTADTSSMSDNEKQKEMEKICGELYEEFCEYTKLKSTEARHAFIHDRMENPDFVKKFDSFKVTDPKKSNKALSFGHIQKMFNIAIKLYLCLKICAESFRENPIILAYGENVVLDPQMFELLSGEDVSADCPIDHYVLDAIDKRLKSSDARRTAEISEKKFADIPWSKLREGKDREYIEIQKEIAALQGNTAKSNLCFDFENWNS